MIKSCTDHVATVISEPDDGLYDAMNKGIKLASGDIVGILNADDFFEDNGVIGRIVSEFNEKPEADLVFGDVVFIDPKDLTIKRYYSSWNFQPWKLRFGWMPAHPATYIRKSAYDAVGLYRLGFCIAADYDLFVRMLLIRRLHYSKIRAPLVRMRLGGVSTSGFMSNWIVSKEMVRSLRENGLFSNLLLVLPRLPLKQCQLLMQKWM